MGRRRQGERGAPGGPPEAVSANRGARYEAERWLVRTLSLPFHPRMLAQMFHHLGFVFGFVCAPAGVYKTASLMKCT